MTVHVDRRVEYKGKSGWGVALLAILATIGCFAGAYWLYQETYCPPSLAACHAEPVSYGEGGH